MYIKAMDGLVSKLVQKEPQRGLTYLADMNNFALKLKMDHLACFLPGTLMLGAFHS
jgi:hypothetical protein